MVAAVPPPCSRLMSERLPFIWMWRLFVLASVTALFALPTVVGSLDICTNPLALPPLFVVPLLLVGSLVGLGVVASYQQRNIETWVAMGLGGLLFVLYVPYAMFMFVGTLMGLSSCPI